MTSYERRAMVEQHMAYSATLPASPSRCFRSPGSERHTAEVRRYKREFFKTVCGGK